MSDRSHIQKTPNLCGVDLGEALHHGQYAGLNFRSVQEGTGSSGESTVLADLEKCNRSVCLQGDCGEV